MVSDILVSTASDNGLGSSRHQAIISTYADLLLFHENQFWILLLPAKSG